MLVQFIAREKKIIKIFLKLPKTLLLFNFNSLLLFKKEAKNMLLVIEKDAVD